MLLAASVAIAVTAVTGAGLVSAPQARAAGSGPVSDDFSAATLNTGLWSVTDPVGDGRVSTTGTGTSDARLALALPSGPSHDAWGSNRSLRVLQPISDADAALEVKFDSVPTKGFQDEGVEVAQDAANWERFSLYSDGSRLYAFGASTVSSVSKTRLKVAVAAGTSLWLRVARKSSTWTMSYSSNGSSWQSIGSFTQALSVTSAGVYAGNQPASSTTSAPAFTALVDYFFNQASPISPEDGTGPPPADTTPPQISGVTAAPTATGATVSWTTDEPTTGVVDFGTSTSYGATVADTATATTHSVTLSQLASGATYHFAVRATDVSANTASSPDAAFTTTQSAPAAGTGPVSDDFSSAPLRSQWTTTDPLGDGSVSLSGQGTSDARLLLGVPAGTTHDIYNTDNGVRAMQPVGDTDFGVEAKFDSVPSKRYQMQALLVQQDAANWLRFDTYSDGTHLYAYAASTSAGASKSVLKVIVSASASVRLRVTRSGSSFLYQYAADGGAFTTVGTVTRALRVSSVGVAAGNSGAPAPAFTALVDYVFNTASPISPEDGGSGTSGTGPAIQVWYGAHQVFGSHGQPQRWVNVLGNVSDSNGVASLAYTLNGGASRALTVGPNHRRLQAPGDFNADIAWSALRSGDNTVVLRAVDGSGNVSTTQVTVSLVAGTVPTLPYTISWSTSTPLAQQAQVVDGLWAVDSTGLRVQRPGYDRLVDVGALSFKDYDITVPVTVHSFGPGANSYLSNEPLIGLGLRWQGHTAKNSDQPAWYWYPTGALAWFRWYSTPAIEMRGNNDTPDVRVAASMTMGSQYVFKARVQTQSDGSTAYSFKMWPAGGTEPSSWARTITVTSGPANGSVILIAHQVDASFGSVTFSKLP